MTFFQGNVICRKGKRRGAALSALFVTDVITIFFQTVFLFNGICFLSSQNDPLSGKGEQ